MKRGFFDIPELFTQVGLYLHPTDLFACVQVDRAFYNIFIPHLWHTIDDSTEPWVTILQRPFSPTPAYTSSFPPRDPHKDHDWLFGIFQKHGQHIRHLRIQFLAVLQAVSAGGACKGLRSLVVTHGRYTEEEPRWVEKPRVSVPFPPHGQPGQPGGLFGGDGGVPVAAGSNADAEADAGVEGVFAVVPGGLGVPALAVADGVATFAGGLFGVAPAAVGFGGVGGAGNNVTAPPQPYIELSESLFPDLLAVTDVAPKWTWHSRYTAESMKAFAEYEWANTQHLWHLVRTNPGLVQFDNFGRQLIRFFPVSVDFSLTTLRSLRNLKVLNTVFRSEKVEFWKLWSCLPAGIETLSVDSPVFPLPNPLPEAYSTNLRILKAAGSTTVNGLLTLLGIFPDLERLTVGGVHPNPINPLDPSFISLPPSPLGGQSLRRLDGLVHDWNTLLRYLPSIVEWSNDFPLCEGDVALLAKRFPRLESFKTTYLPTTVHEEMNPPALNDPTNQFLATNSHLREFDSIDNCVRVDEMLRQPWACMGLERLVCRIFGVDRLNGEEEAAAARVVVPGYSSELTEEEKSAVEKFHRCRAQHHGVYDRLASLTRLKHLDLGYENRDPWEYKDGTWYTGDDGNDYVEYSGPMIDTLELTLESGLGRLAALKDLEMFGFECLNHRIGRAELDWMAKSWPKLKLMYGLDREQLSHIEYDKKRIELRKYFKRLRPEVVHDSSFDGSL